MRQDPAFQALETTFKTKLTLAGELVEQAVTHGLAFDWVLFDSWYLAPELLTMTVRIAVLGKVRTVVSFATLNCTGTWQKKSRKN